MGNKWYGVHTGGPHYLDHLGVLCEGLGIPLIVTEKKTYDAAKEFYPQLQAIFMEPHELSLDFLAEQVDVIFESGHTFAHELIPMIEMLYGKKMRVVYCPHGNSDKKIPNLRKDIILVYGNHMLRQLRPTGPYVVTGNWRLRTCKMKKLDLDPTKKTVLYAPTWEAKGWFQTTQKVIRELSPGFNLLVRLHPFLEDLFPAEYEIIQSSLSHDISGIPTIYPLIQQADYYLGDFSSIGYDFLWRDQPLFFVDQYEGDIFECGTVLKKNEHYGNAITAFCDTTELSNKRRKLYLDVFGKEKSFNEIKADLHEALSQDRASWLTH